MKDVRIRCALFVILLCMSGCKAKGPTTTEGGASTANGAAGPGGSEQDGPTQEEVQRLIIAGLPDPIATYCTRDKQNMIASVKDIRFKLGKYTLLNVIRPPYKIIRVEGTLYWNYRNKAKHEDPAAGEPFSVVMTNDPEDTPDHTGKWGFNGIPPWSNILMFEFDQGGNCQMFT